MSKDKTETTVTLATSGEHNTAFRSIEIFQDGQVFNITHDQLPFTAGRDQAKCQLVLGDKLASREHFALMMRDGLLGLLDKSTNGTWVQLGRSEPVQVKNSFLPLVGSGVIQAGCDLRDRQTEALHFKVKLSPAGQGR